MEHINKFPRQESHYSRGKTQKEYLSPDLNLSKMYRCFQTENPNVAVSKTFYDTVFKQMNLRFGAPRSDTCKICDEFYIQLSSAKSEDDRKKIQQESGLHQSRASLGYQELKADIVKSKVNNSSTVVLCVDMQQVLFCPTLSHSDIFYQRQLSCYNFAIHNMGTSKAVMHLWYECIAGRGSTEIASCIIKYVTMNYNKLIDGEERKLIVWSDRCVGQNNNWRILNTYCYLAKCGYFTEINQKFLSSGHSFLPCDRDFAIIEKAKKSAKVHVPSDWKYVIADAKVIEPFDIIEMSQNDFKDLTSIEEHLPKNKSSSKLQVTKYLWIKYDLDDPYTIYGRASHNVIKPWESFKIFKENWEAKTKPADLQPVYNALLPITQNKKKI